MKMEGGAQEPAFVICPWPWLQGHHTLSGLATHISYSSSLIFRQNVSRTRLSSLDCTVPVLLTSMSWKAFFMVFKFRKTCTIKRDFGKAKGPNGKNSKANKICGSLFFLFTTSCKIKCFQRFSAVHIAQ